MVSIGLSLAEGKRVYDTEKQRRAEMEAYKKDEAIRQARRRMATAQAGLLEETLGTYRKDAPLREAQRGADIEKAKRDQQLHGKVQREIDKNKLAANKIASELGVEEAKSVAQVTQALQKYQSRIVGGDPTAVTEAMAEAGFPGYSAEMDEDGWAGGLTIVGPNGATMNFAQPADALSDLSFLPLKSAISKRISDRAATVEQRQKYAELMNKLQVQELKNRAALQIGYAANFKDMIKALSDYSALSAGLVWNEDLGTYSTPAGEPATEEALRIMKHTMEKGARDFYLQTGAESPLLSGIRTEMATREAERANLIEQETVQRELSQRQPGAVYKGLAEAPEVTQKQATPSYWDIVRKQRTAGGQGLPAQGIQTRVLPQSSIRQMTPTEELSLQRDIDQQYGIDTATGQIGR